MKNAKELWSSMSLDELIKLHKIISDIIMRTHVSGKTSQRDVEFSRYGIALNKFIEDKIYNDYIHNSDVI